MADLLSVSQRGLYCAAGDFYIDPWQAVDRAVITHAHADHARPGSRHYLSAKAGAAILRLRLDPEAPIQTVEYGAKLTFNGVQVSLHPAGSHSRLFSDSRVPVSINSRFAAGLRRVAPFRVPVVFAAMLVL